MTSPATHLNPRIRDSRGLTPAQRAEAMAAAKEVAIRYAWAVKRRDSPEIRRIWNALPAEAQSALALLLAEVADPSKLVAVTQTADNGLPEHIAR